MIKESDENSGNYGVRILLHSSPNGLIEYIPFSHYCYCKTLSMHMGVRKFNFPFLAMRTRFCTQTNHKT